MALRLRISLRAAAQIEKAEAWWIENRPSARSAFSEDLAAALSLLLRQPEAGAKVSGAKTVGARRIHLGRIRYYLFYRVKGAELVVLALWHSSRGRRPAV